MPSEIKVELTQRSPSASEAKLRHHSVLIDRPAAKGGTDAGPMGGEIFLAAVGGCFMSTLLAAIRAREAEVANVHIEVTGTLSDTPPRFSIIELNVTAEGRDRERLDHLVEIAGGGCIMMNTLRSVLELKITIGPLSR